ncbi:hypothetical protein [Yersinia ruckeri]|uniref:Uncharacterized protein n=1 Tax=Yersinia ruckeri TaxID=29486 RepID=A0A0A8VIM5_YERRU|nr:hypothetical protein [Yersinia ruckeri]EEP99170.1 hypothetical protein yruck0001_14930 [Yersinia ruckeri ATCC 29473]MDN0091085.1 hypothetical protein [Yersinia ruckeri]QTD76567.1 Uncharacterized protein YR821_1643 [Yersinia ruckeri]WMS04864.1 hypothetical protein RDY86_13170 [Yersinia ruckeri]CEK27466.1 hypothetical protein CSF007_8565 [Yersinia ruckeri]
MRVPANRYLYCATPDDASMAESLINKMSERVKTHGYALQTA